MPFHAAIAASIRTTLCDEGYKISSQCLSPLRRLHGGGCQRKAKQIRSRNDALVFPCCARSMGQIGSCVCVYTRAPSRRCSAQLLRQVGGRNWLKYERKVDTEGGSHRIGSSFSLYRVPMCPRLAVHFYSAVVIIVIIYHYSGRERKIVSTDDMGAVCRACCNSWDREMLVCKMWV